jgi:hypothetical protein
MSAMRGFWMLAALSVGCGVGPPHSFRATSAQDFNRSSAPNADVAVLLVPRNVRLYREGGDWRRPQSLVDEVVLVRNQDFGESYAGPARVFLAPGRRQYQLEVITEDGRIQTPFSAELVAGGRYLIEIDESDDKFEWSLIKLSRRSYRELYADVVK